MQIRKLVKSGTASYTVALPKGWITKNKLNKGDLLYIDEVVPDRLTISTGYKEEPEEKREIMINVDHKGRNQIYREITSAYLDNYYQINIIGKELNKKVDLIKGRIHSLIALEIIEESSEKVVARDFLRRKELSIKELLRRIDNITKAMMTDARSCIYGYDISSLIQKRDYEVNRLTFLIYKVLKRAIQEPKIANTLDVNNLEILQYWEIATHLEKIADECKRVARLIAELSKENKKVNKKGLDTLFAEIAEHYQTIMRALHKGDLTLADQESSKRPELVNKCTDYFEKNKNIRLSEITGKFKGILSHLDDISRVTRYLS